MDRETTFLRPTRLDTSYDDIQLGCWMRCGEEWQSLVFICRDTQGVLGVGSGLVEHDRMLLDWEFFVLYFEHQRPYWLLAK